MSVFHLFTIVCVVVVALAGGYYPLARNEAVREAESLPKSQAFAAGVFLALSLAMMFPASAQQFGVAFPKVPFPLECLGTIIAFLSLLAIGHWNAWRESRRGDTVASVATPIIMTVMIAIPSFLMGTAIGVSDSIAAVMILVAIMAHKGSAAFALAVAMVRSRLSRLQTLLLFGTFVAMTPAGILFGADLQAHVNAWTLNVVKGVVLSLAAGVFLFMATLHELKHAPLIVDCCTPLGFTLMICGVLVTLAVRGIIGWAQDGEWHAAALNAETWMHSSFLAFSA